MEVVVEGVVNTKTSNEDVMATVLKLVPPQVAERYFKEKAEREAKRVEIEAKAIKKYGFLPPSWKLSELKNAESENAICEKCEGLPCQKERYQNFQYAITIDKGNEEVEIRMKECEYWKNARKQKELEKSFRLSQIPTRYIGKTFADYEVTELNKNAVKAAKKVLETGQSIMLYGEPGRGKTYLAALIAQECLKKGKSVIFGDTPSLLEDLRGSYDNNDVKMAKLMEDLAKADLLILDDLGTEIPTEWTVERLYLIINQRYNAEKALIVTSNFSLGEIAQRLNNPKNANKKLPSVTGDRIVSRLAQMCERYELKGKDKRF